MVLKPLDKTILHRLRSAVRREQKRTGRKLPTRVMKVFGRLKNIDERKLAEWRHMPSLISEAGKNSWHPGYGVRSLKVKGTKGVVLKFPTLANEHFRVTPQEEIRFVRRMVGLINEKMANKGFVMLKPIAHPVGPFIAMQRTKLPTLNDFIEKRETPQATEMLSRLSRQMKMPEEKVREKLANMGTKISFESWELLYEKKLQLSKNYPADSSIEHEKREIGFLLKPLEPQHVQVIGRKNGVIQLVPYIDAA